MKFNTKDLVTKTKNITTKTSEVLLNVVTLGGQSAINTTLKAYQAALEEHGNSVRLFNATESDFQGAVEKLGTETTESLELLQSAQDFVDRVSSSRLTSSLPVPPNFESPDLSQVDNVLANFNAVVAGGQGAGIGMAASTGAWMVVAHLGTASTGAAIGGLTGAAAHSAILAWFGGGALAAGGGGMILGGVVIGGIALLPVIVFSAYKSRKEAARLEAKRQDALQASLQNRENAGRLSDLKQSVESLKSEISAMRVAFTVDFESSRLQALSVAKDLAVRANSFAFNLVASARARGASA